MTLSCSRFDWVVVIPSAPSGESAACVHTDASTVDDIQVAVLSEIIYHHHRPVFIKIILSLNKIRNCDYI